LCNHKHTDTCCFKDIHVSRAFGHSVQLKVPRTGDAQEVMSFRKLLLNRCQHEFETDQKEEGDFARMQEAIDNATSVG